MYFKKISNFTIITDNLHEDLGTFIITSRSFLLRIRNVSNQILTEKQNTVYIQ
jgi:hypothetical protein